MEERHDERNNRVNNTEMDFCGRSFCEKRLPEKVAMAVSSPPAAHQEDIIYLCAKRVRPNDTRAFLFFREYDNLRSAPPRVKDGVGAAGVGVRHNGTGVDNWCVANVFVARAMGVSMEDSRVVASYGGVFGNQREMRAEIGGTVNGEHAILTIGKRDVRVLRHNGASGCPVGIVVAPDNGYRNTDGDKSGDGARRTVVTQADNVADVARGNVVHRALQKVVVIVNVGNEGDVHTNARNFYGVRDARRSRCPHAA